MRAHLDYPTRSATIPAAMSYVWLKILEDGGAEMIIIQITEDPGGVIFKLRERDHAAAYAQLREWLDVQTGVCPHITGGVHHD